MYRVREMALMLVALIMVTGSAGCLAIAELDEREAVAATRGLGASCKINLDCQEGYLCDPVVDGDVVRGGVCKLAEGADCTTRAHECATGLSCMPGGETPGQSMCLYAECRF